MIPASVDPRTPATNSVSKHRALTRRNAVALAATAAVAVAARPSAGSQAEMTPALDPQRTLEVVERLAALPAEHWIAVSDLLDDRYAQDIDRYWRLEHVVMGFYRQARKQRPRTDAERKDLLATHVAALVSLTLSEAAP